MSQLPAEDALFEGGQPLIRSRKNDRLRLVRALGSPRGRRRFGRYLLEGPKVISEVLARRPAEVEQVLYRAGAKVETVLAAARAHGIPCYPVDPTLFDQVAPSETPQPLLAIARHAWSELEDLLGGGEAGSPRGVVACMGVQDPGNLGTVLRSARFLGMAGVVVLPGTQDPWSPKVARGAAGALLEQPPARAEDAPSLFAAARAAGFTPVALAAHDGEPLHASELPARSLFLLGAEGPGLPEGSLAGVEGLRRVTIPSPAPDAESLNVAVAFAVVAYAWCARWRLGPAT